VAVKGVPEAEAIAIADVAGAADAVLAKARVTVAAIPVAVVADAADVNEKSIKCSVIRGRGDAALFS
jgi:hypothetical protein